MYCRMFQNCCKWLFYVPHVYSGYTITKVEYCLRISGVIEIYTIYFVFGYIMFLN